MCWRVSNVALKPIPVVGRHRGAQPLNLVNGQCLVFLQRESEVLRHRKWGLGLHHFRVLLAD